jgi:hypothetical protein
MDFYEVFVNLVSHGKEIGKTCIQVQASSPFMAAVKAEDSVDGRYGEDILSHTLRVSQITEDEFLYQMAA